MIIFLNGASSVGKSTIARSIMKQSSRPFIYYSVDHLVNYWMDEKFVAFDNEPKDWFYHETIQDREGHRLTKIVDGPHAVQLHLDMVEALGVLIRKGYDLIIDEVIWQPEIFQHYSRELTHSPRAYLIKVVCDLIVCERREKSRPDRFKGLARGLYAQVNAIQIPYDLEVDTTTLQSEQAASKILQFVNENKAPKAFKQYLAKRLK